MRIISLIFVLLLAATMSALASESTICADRICDQLVGQSRGRVIAAELSERLFPDGAKTDQCLMELVADNLPRPQSVMALVDSQREDGSWADVEYSSRSRSAWPAQQHNVRLMTMARAYRATGSSLRGNERVLEGVRRGIDYWSRTKPECLNWWYNEIGVPKVFAPLLLLMHSELSSEQMAAALPIIERSQIKMTGQNRVWLAGVVFMRALLIGDKELMEQSSQAIRSELVVTTNEGIQPDFSFHQHGAQQQFGNYGLAFASSQSYWMRILAGTEYDFSPQQREYMRGYMLQGLNKTVWRGVMDVAACGRQLFTNSPEGKAGSLMLSMVNMIDADQEYRKDYENYIARNYMGVDNELTGMTHYYRSDYSIYRAPHFMASVKMCSPRVVGGETTNRENLSGYYMADGAMFTYRTAREYENVFPLWDWRRVPGITCYDTLGPIPLAAKRGKGFEYENLSPFVGGAQAGDYGVSTIELNRDSLFGNKSYFFTPNGVLCLGAGLGNHKGGRMLTSVEQSVGRGSFDTSVKDGQLARRGDWVLHDSIGYISLGDNRWRSQIATQEGSWRSVADFCPDDRVAGSIFSLWIEHSAGALASYAYAVVPNVDAKSIESRARAWRVVANTPQVQCVASGSVVMAVFFKPTKVSSPLGTISVSAPCIVIARGERLFVADPTQSLSDVQLTLGRRKVSVVLPHGALSGSTAEIK